MPEVAYQRIFFGATIERARVVTGGIPSKYAPGAYQLCISIHLACLPVGSRQYWRTHSLVA